MKHISKWLPQAEKEKEKPKYHSSNNQRDEDSCGLLYNVTVNVQEKKTSAEMELATRARMLEDARMSQSKGGGRRDTLPPSPPPPPHANMRGNQELQNHWHRFSRTIVNCKIPQYKSNILMPEQICEFLVRWLTFWTSLSARFATVLLNLVRYTAGLVNVQISLNIASQVQGEFSFLYYLFRYRCFVFLCDSKINV